MFLIFFYSEAYGRSVYHYLLQDGTLTGALVYTRLILRDLFGRGRLALLERTW